MTKMDAFVMVTKYEWFLYATAIHYQHDQNAMRITCNSFERFASTRLEQTLHILQHVEEDACCFFAIFQFSRRLGRDVNAMRWMEDLQLVFLPVG